MTITNKHLMKIIDEYLLIKRTFEDELLNITVYMRNDLDKFWFYSNCFYSLQRGLFCLSMRIKYCNDESSPFYKKWGIGFI